jgi:DNA invertase Pin-like site-specific DNA recombinase
MGKAMFTIVGAMAELERNVIRKRIVAGLEHARWPVEPKAARQLANPRKFLMEQA